MFEKIKKIKIPYDVIVFLILILLNKIAFDTKKISTGLDTFFAFFIPIFYIFLAFLWISNVEKRVESKEIKRNLKVIGFLIVFWIFIRLLKYTAFSFKCFDNVARQLWYLFYIPFNLIALFSFFTARTINNSNKNKVKEIVFSIITIISILLVMTNDLHQLVFKFGANFERWDIEYEYGIGFLFVVGWLVFLGIVTIINIWKNSVIPISKKRVWKPFIYLGIAILYTVLYSYRDEIFIIKSIDMTVMHSLLIVFIWESMIDSGLIISKERKREILDIKRELSEITNEKELLEEKIKMDCKNQKIEEQTNLYHDLIKQTKRELLEIEKRLSEIEKEQDDSDNVRQIIGEIVVFGTYIKRRANLLFTEDKSDILKLEIDSALKELSRSLLYVGIDMNVENNIEELTKDNILSGMDELGKFVENMLEDKTKLEDKIVFDNSALKITLKRKVI